jgi:hypothetical protein
MLTIRHIRAAGSRADGYLATRLLAAVAVAQLLAFASSTDASAQSAAAQIQAETDAMNAQTRALEGKMRGAQIQPAPTPPSDRKDPVASPEQPVFADKKMHVGGVTFTPGGFLALEGMPRQ